MAPDYCEKELESYCFVRQCGSRSIWRGNDESFQISFSAGNEHADVVVCGLADTGLEIHIGGCFRRRKRQI